MQPTGRAESGIAIPGPSELGRHEPSRMGPDNTQALRLRDAVHGMRAMPDIRNKERRSRDGGQREQSPRGNDQAK